METEMESQLRPRDIQARIRAGETAESVAEAAGMPVERVRRYEGPVLAERGHVASLAQATSVRRPGEGPSPALRPLVDARLAERGVDPESAVWDSWRREDGRWTVAVVWRSGAEQARAHWVYDPVRRSIVPDDDAARAIVEPTPRPAPQPEPARAEPVTERPFVPRLAAVPDHPAPAGPAPTTIDLRDRARDDEPVDTEETADEPEVEAPVEEEAAAATGTTEPAQGRRAAGEPRRSSRRASVPSWDDIVFGSRRGD